MAKIKFTKNELKKQKSELRRYLRFLPTLQLKKQQLQFEIGKIDSTIDDIENKINHLNSELDPWVDVFAEDAGLENILGIKRVHTEVGNIAGVDILVLKDVEFKVETYDLLLTPLWVDRGIDVCKRMVSLRLKQAFLKRQKDMLNEELRITTQRVNLFEKVKIPQAKENIRIIRIYLGDLQTAEVVRGKIAKAKISKRTVLL